MTMNVVNNTGFSRFRNFALGAALALASVCMVGSANATVLLVNWTQPASGISISWNQFSNPTPYLFSSGSYVGVEITNFKSTGAKFINSYDTMYWYSTIRGGLFSTPGTKINVYGAQAYSGSENAPIFQIGDYSGFDENQDPIGTLTISAAAVPEPGAWSIMILGVGVIGAARRTRRRLAIATR
jgi:hypothetical protein